MADLGKHAFEVTLAYAGSLVLLAALVGFSLAQARRSKKRLGDAEDRQSRD
ncbi:heme exporter protein CcmD [Rhodobacteraceae bacterium]|nr:heme exporter protein CcmD [Paracoccaceae bacterium]